MEALNDCSLVVASPAFLYGTKIVSVRGGLITQFRFAKKSLLWYFRSTDKQAAHELSFTSIQNQMRSMRKKSTLVHTHLLSPKYKLANPITSIAKFPPIYPTNSLA